MNSEGVTEKVTTTMEEEESDGDEGWSRGLYEISNKAAKQGLYEIDGEDEWQRLWATIQP